LGGHVSLQEVRANLALKDYPTNNLVFVRGMVDESNLEYLYPRLVSGGVLVVDDYGHYQGSADGVKAHLRASGQSICSTVLITAAGWA
jgi:hypothetical protein